MFPGRPSRSARERLGYQTLSSTAPGACAATASSAATLALPTVREAGTSGTGSTVIRASLMVSLAISGRPRAGARAVARVVLPLPGGPDTTTYQPAGHPSVTYSLSRRASTGPGDPAAQVAPENR